ncbi:histidine kinase [Bifidobacterium olomucense]|uniref:histidine kinase n=1 Tax=Bifidobacterium olomucense TaxID=2675324 RepID=A0A7Y0EW44_9BIFI|nr:histidine kinase [Bifidobacterium sp. DSM 109959]NMM97506.1 histidine protein kinase [Bifidobacterium sp. DSM 109959]
MRPIRSALNRIRHPAILAIGLVLAAAILIEMGVYSSQNLLSWSTVRISLIVAVLCAMLGIAPAWVSCLLFAVSGYALLWLFSPLTTIMIAALTSIAVLSFTKPRLGASASLIAFAALTVNNTQNQLTASNIVGMTVMCLCPLSLGFGLNLLLAQRQATAALRRQLDRERTARHLHDTISNDLAYMILRIDQASHDDPPADQNQYQLRLADLRAIAETALDHTHQVIRQLEHADESNDIAHISQTNEDMAGRKAKQQRERLEDIIQTQQRRLKSLGFQGDGILGTFDHPLADDILDLLEGLLNELYANIAKHADPDAWYAVTISFDRQHVIISASDARNNNETQIGLGSGLERYRTVIESISGTFTVTDNADGWNAEIAIPLFQTDSSAARTYQT